MFVAQKYSFKIYFQKNAAVCTTKIGTLTKLFQVLFFSTVWMFVAPTNSLKIFPIPLFFKDPDVCSAEIVNQNILSPIIFEIRIFVSQNTLKKVLTLNM